MPMERALGSTPHRRTDLQHEWTRTDIWPFTHTQRSGIQQYRHRLQLHRRDEPKASPSRAPDEQRSPTLHQISQQTEPMPMPSPALSTAPLRHRALHCRSQRQPPARRHPASCQRRSAHVACDATSSRRWVAAHEKNKEKSQQRAHMAACPQECAAECVELVPARRTGPSIG